MGIIYDKSKQFLQERILVRISDKLSSRVTPERFLRMRPSLLPAHEIMLPHIWRHFLIIR